LSRILLPSSNVESRGRLDYINSQRNNKYSSSNDLPYLVHLESLDGNLGNLHPMSLEKALIEIFSAYFLCINAFICWSFVLLTTFTKSIISLLYRAFAAFHYFAVFAWIDAFICKNSAMMTRRVVSLFLLSIYSESARMGGL